MTNELIEAIPSPLWLITKPGGYKHINQFGRVYRTRELALRHCDVNEMVVELRLAPAPEPLQQLSASESESFAKTLARSPRRIDPSTSAPSAAEPPPKAYMTDEQIKHMVNRFLGWRLPEHFQPDAGITFNPEYNIEYNAARGKPPARYQPIGTNLLGADQAEAMVRYMIKGMPSHEGAVEATGGAVPAKDNPLAEIRAAYKALANDPPNSFTTMRALTALGNAIEEIQTLQIACAQRGTRTTAEDHFLAYSNLKDEPAIKKAFFAGRGENVPERECTCDTDTQFQCRQALTIAGPRPPENCRVRRELKSGEQQSVAEYHPQHEWKVDGLGAPAYCAICGVLRRDVVKP